MPISAYDQPVRLNVANTYERLPLQELVALDEMRDRKEDKALSAIDAFGDMLKVDALSQHRGFKDELLKEFHGRTDELAEQIYAGADPRKVVREITSLRRDWENNQMRKQLSTDRDWETLLIVHL